MNDPTHPACSWIAGKKKKKQELTREAAESKNNN